MANPTADGPTSGDDQYRSGLEVRSGYVFGETFDAKPVEYAVIDGLAVFEGDIILGTIEEMDARRALVEGVDIAHIEATTNAPADVEALAAVIIPGAQFRWPNGVVPFEIAAGLPAVQQTAANNAIAHWRTNSRLNFVQRTPANATQFPDFMRFVPGAGCSSPVGRQGGGQDVTLAARCFFGAAVHEIGHSVGLWHEQSREDRDDFISINFANVDPARRFNFDQHITDGDDVGPYEYGSIMHYGPTAFSINGQPTITATQPLPPGVVMGQQNGLSVGDRAGVRTMYNGLEPSIGNTWLGDFTGDGRVDILYYLRSRMTWYLGSWATGALVWTQVGDTTGFGQVLDGRPFWVGDFDADGRAEILFYTPHDGNWWLGKVTGGQIQWALISNTLGSIAGDPSFGQIWDGRPFWIGNFSRPDAAEVLFYYPGDDNWWLGTWNGTRLAWSFAGNTRGLGHAIDNRPFWVGDFNADGRAEVLMYSPGDGNWWLGAHAGGLLQWRFFGNTRGASRPQPFPPACEPDRTKVAGLKGKIAAFQEVLRTAAPGEKAVLVSLIRAAQADLASAQRALNGCIAAHSPPPLPPWPNFGEIWDGRPIWIGRFSQADRAQVLFYFPGDGNWWLGAMDGSAELRWTFAGNTLGFGQVADGRPFWTGDFTGDGKEDMLFYFPGDDNWWLGSHSGGQLQWRLAGNTAGFGHGINDGRPFWVGHFSRTDRAQMLFYFSGDGNCWLGTDDGNATTWALAATFEA
jgi:Astacin (Peptidase family M12A)